MTDAEWARVVARITTNWPHSLPPEGALVKWRDDLRDLPAAEVEAAVEAIAADLERFPPNGHQIRAKLTELRLDLPEWGAVIRQLDSLFTVPETCFQGGESVPLRQQAVDALPLPLQAFVARVGLEQINRGLDGGSEEARLREKWTTFCQRVQRDQNYAAIPSAGLPALERPRLLGEVVKELAA